MPEKDYQYSFNYYNNIEVNDVTFDGYQVTTNNPGTFLLLLTFFICISCFVIGVLIFPGSPLHPIYRTLLSLLNIGDAEAGGVEPVNGGDEEKGEHKYGGVHDDETTTTTTSSSTRYENGGSPSRPKRSVKIREKPMVAITIRNAKQGPRGKPSRYTAITLKKIITAADKRRAAIRIAAKSYPESRRKTASSKGAANEHTMNRPESASASSEGRLGFEDLTFYLTKLNYDEGRPSAASTSASTKGGGETGSLGESFLDDETYMPNSNFLEGTGLWAEVKEIMALAAP